MPQIKETRDRLSLKEKFQITEDSSAPGFKQSAFALKWRGQSSLHKKIIKAKNNYLNKSFLKTMISIDM